jgi:signal transduction histidine kinase
VNVFKAADSHTDVNRPDAPPRALRLLAEVAHDIRSPLTSILYLVEGMHSGQAGPVTPEQERHLALIYTATFQLNMLVNDLTELAHGGLDLLRRDRICFSLDDVLNSVHGLVRPVAEERQLELRVEKSASDLRFGNPAALTRVLLNLVSNALRVTSSGSVSIEIRERPRACIEVSVRDTGPGLSEDALKRLFEPFTTHGRKRRGLSSAGLGLSICRRLVRGMGSELMVESSPATGTRFFFAVRLPRARATAGAGGVRSCVQELADV